MDVRASITSDDPAGIENYNQNGDMRISLFKDLSHALTVWFSLLSAYC